MRLRKNTKLDLLKSVPLFGNCSKAELEAIARIADEVDVPGGRDLTVEGASGREFVILVDGAADVVKGKKRIRRLSAGEFFGEIALLTGAPRTATVTTTEPSGILVIDHRAFKRLTESLPSVNSKVVQALAERVAGDAL
jgi:CRP/FNR family cyclic AMP-dependent transcriptional regulator